jgi:hypothetical protein
MASLVNGKVGLRVEQRESERCVEMKVVIMLKDVSSRETKPPSLTNDFLTIGKSAGCSQF